MTNTTLANVHHKPTSLVGTLINTAMVTTAVAAANPTPMQHLVLDGKRYIDFLSKNSYENVHYFVDFLYEQIHQ